MKDASEMEELNGRMLACQMMVAALVARMANASSDPLRFVTDFRDEVKAVIEGINIGGGAEPIRIRRAAQASADEIFALMKPPGGVD